MADTAQVPTSVLPRVPITEAAASLLELLPKIVGLVRNIDQPERPSTTGWTAADTAAHLSHVWVAELAMLRDEGPPAAYAGDVARMNATLLADDPERKPGALADRIEWAATTTLALLAEQKDDRPREWLGGLQVPASTLASHAVYECLLHGRDIARSQRRGWSIASRHALVALNGFATWMLAAVPPTHFVDQARADGVAGAVLVRLRGGPAFGMRLAQGELTIVGAGDGPFDCHVSATPAAWLVAASGRGGTVSAAATGRMFVWGRRPGFVRTLAEVLHRP